VPRQRPHPAVLGGTRAACASSCLAPRAPETDALVDTDLQCAWDPQLLVRRVRTQLDRADLADDQRALVSAHLTVDDVVSNWKEFVPFRWSVRGLATVKAPLLVLPRPELGQLLDWPVTETGADAETRQLAALYAGQLCGLSREQASLRSVAFDGLTADWACRAAEGAGPGPDAWPVAGSPLTLDRDEHQIRLLLDDEVLRVTPIEPDARRPVPEAAARMPASPGRKAGAAGRPGAPRHAACHRLVRRPAGLGRAGDPQRPRRCLVERVHDTGEVAELLDELPAERLPQALALLSAATAAAPPAGS
jgi:hypothetical protein